MSELPHSSDSDRYCAELVRNRDFVRYVSTLFEPPPERRALLALYAFNSEITRVRMQVRQPLPGEVRLQWWTDLLKGVGQGDSEGNPVSRELLQAIRTWKLPIEPLTHLINEHQFDLYNDPMPTKAALEGYITATSSALFSLAAGITGHESEEIEHLSSHAGLALGLTQVMTSLPFDASRQQLFLPLQLLESHGVTTGEVFAGQQTPGLKAVLDDLVEEAQRHLQTSLSLLASVPRETRAVFLPLVQAENELRRLARADCDPFVPRVTSRLRVLWSQWRAWQSRPFKA